jgi:hypothetical protein
MTIVKRAAFKYPDGNTIDFALVRREKGDFRWIYSADGSEVSGVVYLSESDAVRAMRVKIDHEPELVGVDLTISAVDPPPEARAATRIWRELWIRGDLEKDKSHFEFVDLEPLADIIANETNIGPLTTAFSELMAYIFLHRARFAQALYPVTAQGAPRDLTMDGLLYTAIEAMQKSTGQDFSNLLKPLKEPVSQIVGAKAMPKQKGVIQ